MSTHTSCRRSSSVASSMKDNVIIVEPASSPNFPGHEQDLLVGHRVHEGHDIGNGADDDTRSRDESTTFTFSHHHYHSGEGQTKALPTIIATSAEGRKRRLSGGGGANDDEANEERDDEDQSVTTLSSSNPSDNQNLENAAIFTGTANKKKHPIVRFRPRVRIGSGVNHHYRLRHYREMIPNFADANTHSSIGSHTALLTPSTCPVASSASSRTASFSSTISAPLRTHPNCNESGWGPLGLRVSAMANGNGSLPLKKCGALGDLNAHLRNDKRKRRAGMTERTPLLGHEHEHEHVGLAEQIDRVFGNWPGRLLNRHWWWWRFEPILCCTMCFDDDEEE